MTSRPCPIDPELLAPVVAPFGSSRTLPGEAYTSDAVLTWEQDYVFRDSWVCIGRAADVCEPGAQRAVRAGSEGLLLTRDESGGLHAFYNVCRHRGHELLEMGESRTAPVIRCPYHAWVYGLDGCLRGAPHFGGVLGFAREDHSLVPARIAEWHGWVFVNGGGEAEPFEDHVGDLEDALAPYEPERLVAAARHDYVVEANWKIVTENYHECYHCPSIHPELCRVSPPESGRNFEATGAWVGGSMELVDGAHTMSLDGAGSGVVMRGLEGEMRSQIYYFGLWPNLLVSPHPDYVMTHRMEPLAPGRTRIECEWLFPPEALEDDGVEGGAAPSEAVSYASDFWDITNMQDWRACESVQRGMSSHGHRQGPLSPREDAVYQFVTMVARAYLEGRVSTPSARSV